LFQYEFKVTLEEPIFGQGRLIHFAVRSTVLAKIKQIIEEKVAEPSDSNYLGPFTTVLREGKISRIFLDARRVNRWTSPDRARLAPINELLEQFYGLKFITSIDMSLVFLPIPGERESKKFTVFLP
jgi:CRISPR/Cas system CMR-associated protein Cmr3 (group 5 of RAMP superfamily)